MPPEQFTMTDIGPHSDWYSFGCIIYELMTGERLFHADDSVELLDEKFRMPSSAWPRLGASGDVCGQLRSALQPILEDRTLDLGTIASWARPVPELAVALDEQPSKVGNQVS